MRWLRHSSLADYPGATSDLFRLVAWVVGLLFLIALLWTATETQVARDEQDSRALAKHLASSTASSYAVQLEHLAAQMDRLTLSIAFDWEDAPAGLDLQRDRERGLFPQKHEFVIAIIDTAGRPIRTSTPLPPTTSYASTNFFKRHAAGCCSGLLISGPQFNAAAGKPLIRFSRRLQDRGGRFAGVVLISVTPDFMVTLQDESQQGVNDFVTVRMNDGTFLATRVRRETRAGQIFYREPPVFGPTKGVHLVSGDRFVDGLARFVSWHRIEPYGMVAIAGLTEHNALAAHRAVAHGYRVGAAIATLFLSLLALAGIAISVHFARGHRAEEQVRRTYRMATDAANEGFYMLSPLLGERGELKDVLIQDCNDRAAALLGLSRAQLVGRHARDAIPAASCAELLAICSTALANGICEDELRVPVQGWLRATWVYRRAVHSGCGIALTLRDISDLKAQEQALADMANKDALTQLPNRRWLTSFLPMAIRRAARGKGRLALMFIDLDNFKTVNDTLGHQAGDYLLKQAAARLGDTVRASDRVARLGGDEFTVVLENIDSDEAVAGIANAIVERLSEPFALAGAVGIRVSASIGVSLYPDHGVDADTLLKYADVAMYAAKGAGKGGHCFYHSSLSDQLLQRLVEEHALREAIDHGEFIMHYQPRVSATTGRLSSIEALVRWQHPERGLLPPSEFIRVADEAGLMGAISEIVIGQVASQLAQWRELGMPLVPVSVNVSPRELQGGQTAARLAQALERHRLAPSLLEVEITESAMVDRDPATTRELDAIRALGIRLMIDDFGTGYSSLAQLHRLDVDVLKVDQAFTRSLAQDSEGELLYRAIVSMAAALDMHVVAEGVETIEQLRLLQAIGCDEIQGYIISPAVPAAAIASLAGKDCLHPFERGALRVLPGRTG